MATLCPGAAMTGTVNYTTTVQGLTLHRYPKEVAQLIQLRGALNRKINARTKERTP